MLFHVYLIFPDDVWSRTVRSCKLRRIDKQLSRSHLPFLLRWRPADCRGPDDESGRKRRGVLAFSCRPQTWCCFCRRLSGACSAEMRSWDVEKIVCDCALGVGPGFETQSWQIFLLYTGCHRPVRPTRIGYSLWYKCKKRTFQLKKDTKISSYLNIRFWS